MDQPKYEINLFHAIIKLALFIFIILIVIGIAYLIPVAVEREYEFDRQVDAQQRERYEKFKEDCAYADGEWTCLKTQ